MIVRLSIEMILSTF